MKVTIKPKIKLGATEVEDKVEAARMKKLARDRFRRRQVNMPDQE